MPFESEDLSSRGGRKPDEGSAVRWQWITKPGNSRSLAGDNSVAIHEPTSPTPNRRPSAIILLALAYGRPLATEYWLLTTAFRTERQNDRCSSVYSRGQPPAQ